jgi:phosphoribosylaminoimidazolecarboxamide formyltransferase/IMP cyclohydrolase
MRALISVSDKTGIAAFAKDLEDLGVEIFSTGGTFKAIKKAGVKVNKVSDITEFEEIMDGRVKTLHPNIHGAILANRSVKSHMEQMKRLGMTPIDLVVVNLYPFKKVIQKEISLDEAIENIDIGGPTMLRSAAKNFHHVTVVVEPEDYETVIEEIRTHGNTTLATRQKLSVKTFEHTANYDTVIGNYFRKQIEEEFPRKYYNMTFDHGVALRYGENPHQKGYYYGASKPLLAEQLWGKELSFNNINDASGAINLLMEFKESTAVNVKHANPCGVATAHTIHEAFDKAYACDPLSIFGGIVALNRPVDEKLALKLSEIFLEIIIAPLFTECALAVLKKKKNVRLLKLDIDEITGSEEEIKTVVGGIIVQDRDDLIAETFDIVTDVKPDAKTIDDLYFAFKVVKHQKSNAICLVKDHATIGLGTGQVSRVFAADNSVKFSNFDTEGAVLASDAFFPFRDSIDLAAKSGVKAIVQPGGSIRDDEVIKACNEQGIVMIFTGMRHFKH